MSSYKTQTNYLKLGNKNNKKKNSDNLPFDGGAGNN